MLINKILLTSLAALPALACELSVQDQLQVQEISSRSLQAGETRLNSSRSPSMECASIGLFTFVRVLGTQIIYFHDSMRAFQRWEQIGISLGGGTTAAISSHLSRYQNTRLESLWSNYGRTGFSDIEKRSIGKITDLTWTALQLPPAPQLARLQLDPLSEEQSRFIFNEIQSKIGLFLFVNGYCNSQLMEQKLGPLRKHTFQLVVNLSVKRGARIEKLEIVVPINTQMAPFVGDAYPGPVLF
jgi:hypothetical protein